MRMLKTMLPMVVLAVAATAQAAGEEKSTFSMKDRQFIQKAAQMGLGEIELGKLALERAQSPETKELARSIVNDHTRANEKLRGIASEAGVTMPTEPTAEQRATRMRLASLSGADFD